MRIKRKKKKQQREENLSDNEYTCRYREWASLLKRERERKVNVGVDDGLLECG